MGYVGKVNAGGTDHLVGSTLYGICATAAGTAAKVVTCADFDTLITGVTIHVKFMNTNTASNATLNVNSTGAKPLSVTGTSRVGVTQDTSWIAGAVVSLTYDGTSWVMNDFIANTDTKETAGSLDSSSKLYLVGTRSQAESAVTFSNSDVYSENGALHATAFNGYTLGAASEKSIGSVASGSGGLVTGGDVYDALSAVHGVPAGGTMGQALIKASGTDYDMVWQTVSSGGETYTLSKSGDQITLTGTGGTTSSVADSNTTYTLTKSGDQITLTGSDGSTDSVTDSDTTALGSMTGTLGLDHGGTGATDAAGALSNLGLTYEDYDFTVTYTAGTVGTRGAQYTADCSQTGKTAVAATIFYINNSTNTHPLAFLNRAGTTLYLNAYRASTSAVSNMAVAVRVFYIGS